jgi:hypothetical protein
MAGDTPLLTSENIAKDIYGEGTAQNNRYASKGLFLPHLYRVVEIARFWQFFFPTIFLE